MRNQGAVHDRPRAFHTIVYGGLVVGVLDGLFALVFYGLILGIKPVRIFQSVASGILGRASYEGGIPTFLLGVLLHFVVAFCIAAVFYVASLKLPLLIRHPVIAGLVYGMLAHLGMNYVVIPLSAIGYRPSSLRTFVPAFVAHAFLVGLPIALLARRSAKAWEGSDLTIVLCDTGVKYLSKFPKYLTSEPGLIIVTSPQLPYRLCLISLYL